MGCYCKPLLTSLGPLILTKKPETDFSEYQLNGVADTTLYCGSWAKNNVL